MHTCYTCHQSPWMQKKVLTFLQNIVNNLKVDIEDNDFFLPLENKSARTLLPELLRNRLPRKSLNCLFYPKSRIYRERDLEEEDCDELPNEMRNDPHESLGELWNNEETRPVLREILPRLVENALAHPWGEGEPSDPFPEKLQELQRTLKLSDEEIDIFLCALAFNEDLLERPCSGRGRFTDNLPLFAKALNLPAPRLAKAVAPQQPLRRLNCLDSDLDVIPDLCEFLNGMSDEPLSSNYFSKNTEETLPWSDFQELAKKHGAILKRMLTSGTKPVNILLYGAPGTGKTSFAQTLAKEVGRTCYLVAQDTSDRSGRVSCSPEARFGALEVCDGMITAKESLIIVDEADGMLQTAGGIFSLLFGGKASASQGDKGLLNSVLDRLKTPTIWIANTPAEALDESSRRRFDYSICFEPLDCEQRKRIWKNSLARLGLTRLVNARQIEEFSAKYPVSAGGISQTLENLKEMHPRKSEIPALVEKLMKPHCELMQVELKDDRLLPSKDYSLEGLNIHGDLQLERIVEAIRAFQNQKENQTDPDQPRMNLLLSGPPGTGKTEFVKYLGDVLNTKVNVCMGSDLLNMYVGGTEKNIARAFHKAESEHAILFLDEIDGLIRNREKAGHAWEVTQVNELLHQMENFKGVMIGATNFLQNLDPAIMRRFTFKLHFDFLTDEGKQLFFQRMFHATLTPEELHRLQNIPNLAPGDFRTVRQSLFYYGGEITNTQRLDTLEQEAAVKERTSFAPKTAIGFA
jgi:transitional endoplasmic reticulum ATPase